MFEAACGVRISSPSLQKRRVIAQKQFTLVWRDFQRLPAAISVTLDHPELEVAIRSDTRLAQRRERLAFDPRVAQPIRCQEIGDRLRAEGQAVRRLRLRYDLRKQAGRVLPVGQADRGYTVPEPELVRVRLESPTYEARAVQARLPQIARRQGEMVQPSR